MENGVFIIKLLKHSDFVHKTVKWEQFSQGQQQNRTVRLK